MKNTSQFCISFFLGIIVADYDPINDDRGSLSRGYEPTSKAMQNTSMFTLFFEIFPHHILYVEYETNQNNNYKSDNGNHNDTQSTLVKILFSETESFD